MKNFFIFAILLLFSDFCTGETETSYRQEAAKVVYRNEKYMHDLSILTYRRTRHSPYLTYANGSNEHAWDNNITVAIKGYNVKVGLELFNLEMKVCDLMQKSWAKDWLKSYSNVPIHCPLEPGYYQFKDLEIPPKGFPIPLPPGDYMATLYFLTTKEKEKIAEIKMNLKFLPKRVK